MEVVGGFVHFLSCSHCVQQALASNMLFMLCSAPLPETSNTLFMLRRALLPGTSKMLFILRSAPVPVSSNTLRMQSYQKKSEKAKQFVAGFEKVQKLEKTYIPEKNTGKVNSPWLEKQTAFFQQLTGQFYIFFQNYIDKATSHSQISSFCWNLSLGVQLKKYQGVFPQVWLKIFASSGSYPRI